MSLGKEVARQPGPGTDERRRWTRYAIDVQVRAVVKSGSQSRTVHGRGSDISVGGMALYLATELVIGEVIEVDVTLPYATVPFHAVAVVRSRRSYQYGVEYVNLSPAARAGIQRACASLALVQ
jgi:c-di-GMP-binding flagellar brake protein YcgR